MRREVGRMCPDLESPFWAHESSFAFWIRCCGLVAVLMREVEKRHLI